MAETPSIVCPVCSTSQPNAWFCVVCGKALHDLPKHLPVETPVLPDLELTAAAPVVNAAVVPLEGLEPTHHAPEPAPFGRIADVEPTAAAEVPMEPLPGFEPTAVAAPSAPTPYGPVVCRYCGTPWTPGTSRVCDRCGGRIVVPDAYLGAGEGEPAEGRHVVCPSCGAWEQVPGRRCVGCGGTVPAAE
jgi:DNA-directed RNA polymerase subunit RPC12/RpoP